MESKPKLVRVTGDELFKLLLDKGALDVPVVHGSLIEGYWCDPDQLRAWRAAGSTSTSEGDRQ
jgi:hypothetical protein